MFTLYDNLSGPGINYTIEQPQSNIGSHKRDNVIEWGAFLQDCHLYGELIFAKNSSNEDIEICNGIIPDEFLHYKETALEGIINPLAFVIIPSLKRMVRVKNSFSNNEKQSIEKPNHLIYIENNRTINPEPDNPKRRHFDFDAGLDEIIDEETGETFYRPDLDETLTPERLEKDINNEIDSLCKLDSYESDCKSTKASIVAETMTADFHKQKGYLDSKEKSALFGCELLKLFNKDGVELKSDCGDAVLPISSDITVIITDQSADDVQIIDREYIYTPIKPQHNPYGNDFTKFIHTINTMRYAQCSFDKCKTHKILVFRNENKIRRGRNDFDINELYKCAKHGNKSEDMVSFQGIYEFDHEDEFSRLILRRTSNKFDI